MQSSTIATCGYYLGSRSEYHTESATNMTCVITNITQAVLQNQY